MRVEVDDRAGVLARVAECLAAHEISVSRLIQRQLQNGAVLHVVTHEAPMGELEAAVGEIAAMEETRGTPSALPVISDRGVAELGWS